MKRKTTLAKPAEKQIAGLKNIQQEDKKLSQLIQIARAAGVDLGKINQLSRARILNMADGGKIILELEESGAKPVKGYNARSHRIDAMTHFRWGRNGAPRKDTGNRWKTLATMALKGLLEKFLSEIEAEEKEIAIYEVLRRWIKTKPKRKRKWGDGEGKLEIRKGDFRKVLKNLPECSASLVLTDPPYGEDYLSLWNDLGEFAAKVLKTGGSLIAYSGQAMLPEVLSILKKHLRYWWTLALDHRHGGQRLPGKWVIVEWKPIIWFVKENRAGKEYLSDRVRGSIPEKFLRHAWAQGVEEVFSLIEALTAPGELIVDPFAGTGAFGKAAAELGREFIGAELSWEPTESDAQTSSDARDAESC